MAEYTKYQRGSEWRRWDLHIHTPGTKKNDQFEGRNLEEKWEKFIELINNSEEEISVVGITDYFSLDNYFKFKGLVQGGRITKQFSMIIPNVELRITPVTHSSKPINIHCLFNPCIDSEIEDRFLSKLKFPHQNSTYSAKSSELCRLGRDVENNPHLAEEEAIKKGAEQYVITHTDLMKIFEEDSKLKKNTIIVVANSGNDGVSGIVKHSDFFTSTGSQLDATRQSIYQFSDAVFSGSESDKVYFIGKGTDSREQVVRKCGSLKPCYHGSDAHTNIKLFKPDENRFCWIKADPTFEGLKQTLYEPEDRIKIQAFKPDSKIERFIISEIQFLDSGSLFGYQKILLNDNLNAIIGGKSSGKSLLLYSIAKSIDPDQVNKTSKRLKFEGYKFEPDLNFKVVWKNGDEDELIQDENKNHKITYIPQLYINYLVEKNNKDELNILIENILKQDTEFKFFYEKTKDAIEEKTSEVEKLLNDYLQDRSKLIEIQQKKKSIGKSETISKGIETTQKNIENGQKLSNLSPEEFKIYNGLVLKKSETENSIKKLIEEEKTIGRLLGEAKNAKVDVLGRTDVSTGAFYKGKIDKILDELSTPYESVISLKNSIQTKLDQLIKDIEEEIKGFRISERKIELNKDIDSATESLKPYTAKIAGQQELQKLAKMLDEEKQKLQEALSLEKQYESLLENYNNLRSQITDLLFVRFRLYKEIVEKINNTKSVIGSDITLNCSLLHKQENFALTQQVRGNAISKENYYNELSSNGLINYELVIGLFSKALRVFEDKLTDGKEISIPLRQNTSLEDVLRGLVRDSLQLDYTVSYKNDDLLNMSPGKKGTVLLILFLQISSSEFPILIDQPEDNLDNRTIYELLCKMIKEKKKERQIIIVSHNANLVVSTDTENIIVANQAGQDSNAETTKYRFEYVNGSLEHSFAEKSEITEILKKQGIKEHVCDILEGGNEAFKQRERKYAIDK